MAKINIVLDATMLDTFQSCFYKFDLRFNHQKGPLMKPEPLDRGDLMHHGKEGYYLALAEGKPHEAAIEAGLISMRKRTAEESDLPYDEANRLLEIFQENVTRWRIWDQSIIILAVEQPFSYVLYEDEQFRIVMIGKIDLLFSDNNYTKCPMDTKTYSRDFEVRRWNNQFMNYAVAMDSNFLFVDRVGLHSLPHELKNPKNAKPPAEKHKRIPLSFDPLIKQHWKDNTIKWAMMYYDCVVNNDWPQNLTSCDKYNRTCEYLEICDTSGIENKIYKLETNFKSLPKWDVSSTHGLKKESE